MTTTRDALINEARFFLETLFDPQDVIEFRCKNESSGKVDEQFWWTLREVDFETLMAVNDQRRHIWFGVNPRSRRGGTSGADVEQCRAVCLDLDGVTPTEGLARIRVADLPSPTLAISSGGGSQFFWRFSRPVSPQQWHRKQKTIIRRVRGADESIHDAPRAMRLPGFRNWKEKYSPTFPLARLFLEEVTR